MRQGRFKLRNLKKTSVLVALVVLLAAANFFDSQAGIYVISLIGLLLVAWDYLYGLAMLAAMSQLSISLSGPITWVYLVVSVFAVILFHARKHTIDKAELLLLSGAMSVVMFSVLFGVTPSPVTGILFVIYILFSYEVAQSKSKPSDNLIIVGLVSSGLCLAATVTYQMIVGEANFLYGTRLAFEGNVRVLANAISVPLIVSVVSFMKNIERGDKIRCAINLFVASWLFVLLLLTYSRGVLLAVLFTVAVLIWVQYKGRAIAKFVVTFTIVAVGCFLYASLGINSEFMMSNVESGSGRIEIWSEFFSMMSENGIENVLFGFGPGDLKRISAGTAISGYYAHSSILDVLFSYGVVAFIPFVVMMVHMFVKALRSGNLFSIAFACLAFGTSVTHGNSNNLMMFMLIGIAYSCAQLIDRAKD